MSEDRINADSANNAAYPAMFREALELALSALETERDRVGAELHSGVAQDLTGLIFKLTECQHNCSDPAAAQSLANILKQVDQILESVRRISSRASPPLLKEIGLAAALGWLTDYAPRHRGMSCELRCKGGLDVLEVIQVKALFRWARWLIDQIQAQTVHLRVDGDAAQVMMEVEFFAAQPKSLEALASEVTVFAITERVRRVGGQISVKNAPDRVVFSISLPTGKVPERAWTVLLCDENAQVRQVTAAALEAHGFTVMAAGGPGEALTLAASSDNPVHLLVTDAMMKSGSGRSLFETLRVTRPRLQALFMGTPEETVEATEHDHHRILKPFAPRDLIQAIRRVLT